MKTPGRKKGQTAETPAKTSAFTIRTDPTFWKRVKMLAIKTDSSLHGLIIDLLNAKLEEESL